jgi:peptidoglycan/xylan/chitin deacetylase (PgdA/CDA1 family)
MPKYRKSICFFICTMIILLFSSFNSQDKISHDLDQQEKIIYLTFDDGPSVTTNKILDILKDKKVHATFFVIGNQIKDNEDIIMRINDEGHAIGLHTFTHDHNKIYSSNKTFIKEMITTRDMVNKITNTLPNIIRFPEGSRNHLTQKSLKTLHRRGFKIYDWNMVISDGLNYKTSPDKLYREATKQKVKPDTIILLMHCDTVHKNTCKALPRIINYYKNLNYDFRVITTNTLEQYFPIKR